MRLLPAKIRTAELSQNFRVLGKTTMLGILLSTGLNAMLLVLPSPSAPSQAPQSAVPPNSPSVSSDEDQQPLPVSPAFQQIVPATTRSAALQQARSTVGKHNPFEPITDFKPFPRGATEIIRPGDKQSQKPKKVFGPLTPGHIPAPPNIPAYPTTSSQPQQDLLSPNELPQPPEKPALSPKLKLCAILGNRALFTFTDQLERIQNKWPVCISLATGEQFESISVIDVTPDTVTLEEDGEREVKQLQRIR